MREVAARPPRHDPPRKETGRADFLIASIQAALTDEDLMSLRDELVSQGGAKLRSRALIVDVTALDLEEGLAIVDRMANGNTSEA